MGGALISSPSTMRPRLPNFTVVPSHKRASGLQSRAAGHRGEQVRLSASIATGFPFVSTTSIYAGSIQLAQLQARRRHPCVLDRHCLGLARTPRRLEFAGGITSLHQRVLHSTTLGDIENVAVAPPSPHLSFLFHAHPFLFSVDFFLLHVHSLHSFTS